MKLILQSKPNIMVLTNEKVIDKIGNAEILYIDLPEPPNMSSIEWITYFGTIGIRVNKEAQKLLMENLTVPTTAMPRKMAIISMNAEHGVTERPYADLARVVQKAGLVVPSMEGMCQLRNNYSERDIREWGSDGALLALYPELTTHGDEYLLPGLPQWLGLCQHMQKACLYAHPFSMHDPIKTSTYYVYEVPVR